MIVQKALSIYGDINTWNVSEKWNKKLLGVLFRGVDTSFV